MVKEGITENLTFNQLSIKEICPLYQDKYLISKRRVVKYFSNVETEYHNFTEVN